MIFIYSLADPITKEVKYIGKTNDLKIRYHSHISDFDKITPIKYWCKSLVNSGKYPLMEIIDIVPDREWSFWENFYIELFRTWGFELKNYSRWTKFIQEPLPNISVEDIFSFRHYLLPVPKYYLNAGLNDIDGEVWKDIPHYEGLYQSSNLGRIKSLSRSVQWKGVRRHKITSEIIMKQHSDDGGYKLVSLIKDRKKKKKSVHRLVLMAFRGMPTKEKSCGMHLDDDPSNNILENLKWGSNSENEQQAYDKGRKFAPRTPGKRGSKHSSAKRIVQMDVLGNELITHFSIADAGIYCNIKRNNISSCLIGKQKTSGGYKWKYAANITPIKIP